jgi:ankyrin repeat protein
MDWQSISTDIQARILCTSPDSLSVAVCRDWVAACRQHHVSAGILVRRRGWSGALCQGVKHGRYEFVRALLSRSFQNSRDSRDSPEEGVPPGWAEDAFVLAAKQGDVDMARLLLDRLGVGGGDAVDGSRGAATAPLSANCLDGAALTISARQGHVAMVEFLLTRPYGAPHADNCDSQALIQAAEMGHACVARVLFSHEHHPACADAREGAALLGAIKGGHDEVVRVLLEQNASLSDISTFFGTCIAAGKGHVTILRLLLEWPQCAPRADAMDGTAMCFAASNGHHEAVRLLLEWPVHAPRADVGDGKALIVAASMGHMEVVRLLMEWPVHAARADCQNGAAVIAAARGGYTELVRMLEDAIQQYAR